MTPLVFNLGPTELLIILAIVLLLFGGSRLAGLGKSTGRALKEFKEETKGLRGPGQEQAADHPYNQTGTTQPGTGTVAPEPQQTQPTEHDVRRDS